MVIATRTLGVHLHLAVDHFVVHLDVIIIHRIEVNILLTVFARKRLAQNIQIVFLDVSIQFLTQQLVYFLCRNVLAETFFQQSHGHLSRTETRHTCFSAEILQSLLYPVGIVGLFHLNGKHRAYFVNVF